MDKIKLLTYSVIALLLLNLATIGFLALSGTFGEAKNRNRPQPRQIIIEKLHLDEGQQQEYEQLIDWHRSQINRLDEQIRMTKNKLYRQLLLLKSDNLTEAQLIDSISIYQKQIEIIHFKHFMGIKKICRKEQLEAFYSLTEELSKLFSSAPKPRKDD